MERTQLFDLMGELKLYGMKAAFDEIMATAVKRQHEPQRIVGDLLTAEVSEKQARSIRYQLTIAKLPLAKDLDDFEFAGTPINQTLVRDLTGVPSSPSSATPCWSAVPAPARPTWPSPLPVNPHLFRDCLATSLATDDPEAVLCAVPILGHTGFKTMEQNYNQATMLTAGREFASEIIKFRNELLSMFELEEVRSFLVDAETKRSCQP